MKYFYRLIFLVFLKPLEPSVGRTIALFAGIRVTDRHTHRQTHKTTAVTLTVYACRGLIMSFQEYSNSPHKHNFIHQSQEQPTKPSLNCLKYQLQSTEAPYCLLSKGSLPQGRAAKPQPSNWNKQPLVP